MQGINDPELTKKVEDLLSYCKTKKIPLFLSAYDKEHSAYWNRTVTPSELGLTIPDDKYPDFLRVLVGFDFSNYKDEEIKNSLIPTGKPVGLPSNPK